MDTKVKKKSYITQLQHDLKYASSDEMRSEIEGRIEAYKLKKHEYYKANKHIWTKKENKDG